MENPGCCLEANDQLNRPSHVQVVWVSATCFCNQGSGPQLEGLCPLGRRVPLERFLIITTWGRVVQLVCSIYRPVTPLNRTATHTKEPL